MTAFSSYELLAKMGQGGMAEVFKAIKSGPDGFSKTVALKKILPFYSDQPRFIKMLSTEAKIHSYLNHTNIVQILDFFEEDGQYCMVLEFVDGKNLKEIILACKKQKQQLGWQGCIYITLEILKALTYAHQKENQDGPLQIIHRDVSPHNILVSYAGEVKLSDFGIARAKIERDETASGVLKGKYRYLSPEQILGENLTPASDLFSVGISLYEMLSFQHPFGEAQEYQTLQKIVDQPHLSLRATAPKIKPELYDIVEKALEKNVEHRFQSAREFYEELLEIQDPSWVTHGQELFQSFLVDLIPLLKQEEMTIEKTAPLQKHITSKHSILQKNPNPASSFRKNTKYTVLFLMILSLVIWSFMHFSPLTKPSTAIDPVKTEVTNTQPAQKSPVVKKTFVDLRKSAGELEISGPANTNVYINGKNMGVLPMPTLRLSAGSYTILFQNDQLGKKMKSIMIDSQKTSKVAWE